MVTYYLLYFKGILRYVLKPKGNQVVSSYSVIFMHILLIKLIMLILLLCILCILPLGEGIYYYFFIIPSFNGILPLPIDLMILRAGCWKADRIWTEDSPSCEIIMKTWKSGQLHHMNFAVSIDYPRLKLELPLWNWS